MRALEIEGEQERVADARQTVGEQERVAGARQTVGEQEREDKRNMA